MALPRTTAAAAALLPALLLLRPAEARPVDYGKVKEDILNIIDSYPDAPDGSIAPLLFRLAWHSAAHWDPHGTPPGGASGATMRFEPESEYYENRGLKLARDALLPLRDIHSGISFSDLWVLAGYVAIEHMGGPHIEFKAGRVDAPSGGTAGCPAESRIPGWNLTLPQMKAQFGRMGMDDREMVALMGGHTVGYTHPENSGFPIYHWDLTDKIFDNGYYKILVTQSWSLDEYGTCGGVPCRFYFNRSWIMLLVDYYLRTDAGLRVIVDEYAEDEERWHRDFAAAFKRLTEAGMPVPPQSPDLVRRSAPTR